MDTKLFCNRMGLAAILLFCSSHVIAQGDGAKIQTFRSQANDNLTDHSFQVGSTYRITVKAKGFTPRVALVSRFTTFQSASARRFGNTASFVYTPKRKEDVRIKVRLALRSRLTDAKPSYKLIVEKAAFKPVKNFQAVLKLQTHEVKLKGGKSYSLSATSDTFSPELRLVDGAKTIQVQSGRRIGKVYVSQITHTAAADGTFRVIVCKPSYTDNREAPLDYTLEVAALTPLLDVKGKLTAQDPKYKSFPKSHFKVYPVKMEKGKTYQIDMGSTFDTYLLLENSAGKVLSSNDDGGKGLNSRIVFRPTATGTFRIIATALNQNRTGPFTLSVLQPGAGVKGKVFRSTAIEKSFWVPLIKDVTYRLTGKAAGFTPETRISDDGGAIRTEPARDAETQSQVIYTPERTHDGYLQVVPARQGRLDKTGLNYAMTLDTANYTSELDQTIALNLTAHHVAMKKATAYLLSATSAGFSPRIHFADGKQILEEKGYGRRKGQSYFVNMMVFPIESAKYRIIVERDNLSMRGAADNNYQLTVRPVQPVITKKEKLTLNDPVTQNQYRHKIFEHRMVAKQQYYVTLTSDAFRPYLRLESAAGSFVSSSTSSTDNSMRLSYTPFRTGTYRIIVSSGFRKRTGDFELKVFDGGEN